MNKRFGSLMLMLCFAFVSLPLLAAETDGPSVELEVQTFSSPLTRINAFVSGSLKGSPFGYYIFMHQASDGYRAIYAGPTRIFADCVEVGVGVGRENEPYSARRNVYVLAECGKFTIFVTYENGGSGSWHRFDLVGRLTEKFKAGIGGDTTFGYGPRLEYEAKKDVTPSVALFHDGRVTKKNVLMISVDVKF